MRHPDALYVNQLSLMSLLIHSIPEKLLRYETAIEESATQHEAIERASTRGERRRFFSLKKEGARRSARLNPALPQLAMF